MPETSCPDVILCCYTKLAPETRAALAAHAPEAELADVSGDTFGYWREIRRRWGRGSDLVTVEHDIVIRADVLPSFAACPSPWCVFPYEIFRGPLDRGLGCTRFRQAAMAAVSPAQIQEWPGCCELCTPGGCGTREAWPGCWRHLDCKISWSLEASGLTPCVHGPAVEHLNWAVMGNK